MVFLGMAMKPSWQTSVSFPRIQKREASNHQVIGQPLIRLSLHSLDLVLLFHRHPLVG